MKFTCNVADFREAYAMASHTLDRSKTAESTKLLLVQAGKGRVLVFSTDCIAASLVKVKAEVAEQGTVLTDPKEIGKTLANLEDEDTLEFHLKDGRLQFRCGNFKPRCATADPDQMA